MAMTAVATIAMNIAFLLFSVLLRFVVLPWFLLET